MKKVLWFGLLGGLAYLGVTYYPIGQGYFRIRYEAQKLAIAGMASERARGYEEIKKFVDEVRDLTDAKLNSSDVTLDAENDEATVIARYEVTARFPFVDYSRTHKFRVEVTVERGY